MENLAYSIRLSRSDYDTLLWLAVRGYDGTILENSEILFQDDEGVMLGMEEHKAWQVQEYINLDAPEAFLTCNGSATLADALLDFLEKIV